MLEFLKNRAELAVEYAETASPGVVRGGLDKQVELALLLLLVLNELNELIRDLCADEPAPLNFRLRLRFQQNPAGPADFVVVVAQKIRPLPVQVQVLPARRREVLYELERFRMLDLVVSAEPFCPDLGYHQLPRLLDVQLPDGTVVVFVHGNAVVYHLELEFALVVHDQLVPALAVQLLGNELFLEAEHLEMD